MLSKHPKDKPGNLPVGRNMRRKAKKGNSTQKAKKTRSASRLVEVKIRLSAEDYARGQPYFDELKYLPKFFVDAYMEKVNRAESNSKSARLRTLMGNIEILEPVLIEMAKCGKLNFLKEIING
jgi:hypothetical protein